MNIRICFELSDSDQEHILRIANRVNDAATGGTFDPQAITKSAKARLSETQEIDLPEFIRFRLGKLETLVRMIEDDEWKLNKEDQDRVLNAIAYFANPEDMIPDPTPGIGFLDDAIMVELILDNLQCEIEAYDEFCIYRSAEEKRRENQGLDTSVGREDWLADQRAVLHRRMRERRAAFLESDESYIRLW